MALTPEQSARLLAGLNLTKKATAAGLPAPATRNEARLYEHIDSQNSARNALTPSPVKEIAPANISNLIRYPGAPKTLAESGLAAMGFQFDESQAHALKVLLKGKHVCLIGAAGTGKTTMVKHALANIIYGNEEMGVAPLGIRALGGDQGLSIAICAFTGIATQVVAAMLPEWIRVCTRTIHSLLEYKPTDEEGKMFVPTRNAMNKLDHDIIVIDEASMLGLDLWHNLVNALRPNTRIILIGDLNQLKPVADATMFAYALSAAMDGRDGWSIAELTTIHRQKEEAANRIIDAAHAILNGKPIKFDNPGDPDWRVINYELPIQPSPAHNKIVNAVEVLRKLPTPGTPERPLFDPYHDLLLCAGNGWDENDGSAFVQQNPLNGTLSRMIEPPTDEHPLFIIDAGRETKRFAVGHRVMATKNESPDMKDRVTNGLTGRITKIENNTNWRGNKAMFGTEKEVMAWRNEQAKAAMNPLEGFSLAAIDTSDLKATEKAPERQASHVITVKFNNGAERTYRSAPEVESIRLAYAITTHKAQGSQADTVIVVVHQAVKKQLSREWFYTAVTRARRRVIVLSTPMGLSTAIARQQIFGKDLREKVNRYRAVMEQGNVMVRLKAYETTTEWDNGGDDE